MSATIPSVPPEVLLILTNAYKLASESSAKALFYTESLLDNASKKIVTLESQQKVLEDRIRSLETQLSSQKTTTTGSTRPLIEPTSIVDNVGS